MSEHADLSHLPTSDLEVTLRALEAGRLSPPLTLGKLAASGLTVDRAALVRACRALPAAAIAPVIAAVLAERERRPPAVELVWTGPEPSYATARDTRRVLDHLFRAAQHQVLIAGFAFDHGASLFQPLFDAIEQRGVACELFFDVPGDQYHVHPDDEERVVSAYTRAFLDANWPWSRRPRFFYDPRRFEPRVFASLHAKCVVVDDQLAFVTSANFTDRGQTRNTEVGVLLDAPHLAGQLGAHFRRCADEGLYRLVPDRWLPPPTEPS